jgi:uncharacterized damage-inducible protein DinB
MSESISKSELIDRFSRARAEWDDLLARMTPEQMQKPRAVGEWSVKDIIVHLTWYEKEMVGVLRSHMFSGSKWWDISLDERNRMICEESKDRQLAEVLDESRLVYQAFIQGLESLPEADLYNPASFPGMPSDWQPLEIFSNNSYEHYEEHGQEVRAWLEKSKQ